MEKKRILVVEDEGITLIHMTKVLEQLGYEVVGDASSADEAFMKATEFRPDLILLDIVLKGKVDGIDVGDKIRTILNIPIIYLTAHDDEATLERAKVTEPYGYIVKPFREKDLYISIEFALYRFHAEAEIRRLNRELRLRTTQMEQSYKDLESFSVATSHDLREPLMVIEWFSGRLLKRYSEILDDDGKQTLVMIRERAKQMSKLVKDLLFFSRLNAKEIVKSSIDMTALVEEIIDEMRAAMAERDVHFAVRHMFEAYGDPSMMRQVLINLLSNSIKYTRGRIVATIEVGSHDNGDENETVYYVKDNGIGFDGNDSDQLFAPFRRLESSQEFEGSGIGLFIVKRIIEKQGGTVWAEGRRDEGATFYFSLPGRVSA